MHSRQFCVAKQHLLKVRKKQSLGPWDCWSFLQDCLQRANGGVGRGVRVQVLMANGGVGRGVRVLVLRKMRRAAVRLNNLASAVK